MTIQQMMLEQPISSLQEKKQASKQCGNLPDIV